MNMPARTPSIVNLQCGCFFRGAEFYASNCEEHAGPPDALNQEVFPFDELSPSAKEHARDYYRETGIDDGWWDAVYEDADAIAAMIGIEIKRKHHTTYSGSIISGPQIWFSGFSSQGDGACFEGNWHPAKDPMAALSAVMEHAPQDAGLHEIAFALAHMSERCNALIPDAYAHVEATGNICNSRSARIDVELPTPHNVDEENELQLMVWNALVVKHGLAYEPFEQEIKDALRAFMDWIYRQLEEEDAYLRSDAHVDEMLADQKFDEDGEWLP